MPIATVQGQRIGNAGTGGLQGAVLEVGNTPSQMSLTEMRVMRIGIFLAFFLDVSAALQQELPALAAFSSVSVHDSPHKICSFY